MSIRLLLNPSPDEEALRVLWDDAWGIPLPDRYVSLVLPRSLVHCWAYADTDLVGFANVAWDGGEHAFLLDTSVRPSRRRQGIGRMMVDAVVEATRKTGVGWLHVYYEPHLEGFYRSSGFQPTLAGLVRLNPRSA